jgi:hypothetical protein
MGENNPPPDLTSWEDDLLNLNGGRQASTSGLNDVKIGNFYDDDLSFDYNANDLLRSLKKKIRPLEERQVELLKQFICTPKVGGKNQTTNSFSSCVYTVANFTMWWDKKIKKYIAYIEESKKEHPPPRNDRKIVTEVRRHLSRAYNRFHYSPNNAYVDSQPIGRLVFILLGTQISALFMVDRTMVQDTLLHNLAQIFTGSRQYHDADDLGKEYSLPKIPHNCIFYEYVLVMRGNMIDQFIGVGYLKWASGNNNNASNNELNELVVSSKYRGNDGGVVFPPLSTTPTVNDGMVV